MLAAVLAGLLPSLTLHEILWRLPYTTASWLFVQSARKNGVKGIGRRREEDAIYKRYAELKNARKKEDGKEKEA